MAQFQERIYHPDTTEKHVMTAADIMFLAELQRELNTQPNMGNADPLYWTIAQKKEYPTAEDFADAAIVIDSDGDTVARSLEELSGYLDDGEVEGVAGCKYFNMSCTVKFDDGTKAGAYSMDGVVEILRDAGIKGLEVRYVLQETETVKDELFLTHKDCEQHLSDYGYNYGPDAHAYAMTAVRSPRYEQLLKIIRTVDWGRLLVSGPSEGA